jgi:hypothetical protein
MKHIFSAHKQDTHEALKFILLICTSFICIFIFFDFVLLTYWQIKEYIYQPVHSTISSENVSSEVGGNETPVIQAGKYEADVKKTLLFIRAESVDVSVYRLIRENLLQLTVPREYLDFHLALIIKIDTLLTAFDQTSLNPSRELDLAITQQTKELKKYLASVYWLEN